MPKIIISKSKVNEQYRKISEISDAVSYSLKTNTDIGKILEENTPCLFSVHFLNSLNRVKDKNRVIFFAQGWKEELVKNLITNGITKFVVDNYNDFEVLDKFLDKKLKPDIFLRIRMKERTIHTERHFVFGFSSVNELIEKIKKSEKYNKIGIHFHRKTQNIGEWNLIKDFNDFVDDDILEKIDYVNIGGGIPVQYRNNVEDVSNEALENIKKFKLWLNEKEIKLISEPGRFIAGPSAKLETEIINIYDNTIVIDCSVYNSFMDTFIANLKLLVENEKDSGEKYLIKGTTPDSLDVFRYEIFLENPKIGDKIIFLNTGAYNFSSDFCDLKKPDVAILD